MTADSKETQKMRIEVDFDASPDDALRADAEDAADACPEQAITIAD
jgi:ferredoxin